ncbi:MAG: 16S rRNA (guanine(527)-N(7))-methyltransferase RsmG [Acidobacteriaceae bacterium]
MRLSGQEIAPLLSQLGLSVSPELASQLSTYLTLLLKWNARTNLTAIREPHEIVQRHFADSLFCAGHIFPSASTLLDFGSGGGFPGIPIALARPQLHVTLAESQNRKAAFLHEAVRSLNLNAKVWSERVESMPAGQRYDAVALRAVDQMESACQIAATKIIPGGQMLVFTTDRLQISVTSATPFIRWQEPLRIPHSDHGLLLLGHR